MASTVVRKLLGEVGLAGGKKKNKESENENSLTKERKNAISIIFSVTIQ